MSEAEWAALEGSVGAPAGIGTGVIHMDEKDWNWSLYVPEVQAPL